MMNLKESYFAKSFEEFQKDFCACAQENLRQEIFEIFRAQYYKWKDDKSVNETNLKFDDKLAFLLRYDTQELQGVCKKTWLKELQENADEIYDSLYVESDDRDYDSCELLEFYGEDYDEAESDDEDYESWRESQNDFEYALMDKLKGFE
ncbi:hypothetical protein [Helicobacter sp. MIT 03-1614]|uniref:hypothetical protein n=2 Tax=Helicobacter TaxID=209 RepID=UPI001F1EBFE2|nr:hypothetical protein [Helicobacter sp. MIT 03-1614]